MAAREKWIKSNSNFSFIMCRRSISKNEVVVVNRALSQQQIAIQIVIV